MRIGLRPEVLLQILTGSLRSSALKLTEAFSAFSELASDVNLWNNEALTTSQGDIAHTEGCKIGHLHTN
jgi:hypothetical protein